MSKISNRAGQIWQSNISNMTMIVVGPWNHDGLADGGAGSYGGHLTIVVYEGRTTLTNVSELEEKSWEKYSFLKRLL